MLTWMALNRVRYFSTSIPGAGIFLPINRAVKRASPPGSLNSVPSTPTMPNMDNFNLSFSSHAEHTPAPAPKFSQSVSAARAQSPAFKSNNSRPSLPRPESPLRRPMNSSIANATTTPGRPSLNMLSNNRIPGPRYAASPAPGKPPTKAPGKPPSYTSPPPSARTTTQAPRPLSKDVISGSDDEVAQLRSLLAEKNEKIAALTAEFDGHRADFRNTLDSLELASAETDRVYEGRIDELLAERSDLLAHREGVETVAQQLEELQEVVVELEEGLEDARRGEAEARGEVEFLRGEVERVRAELRRERERNAEGGGYVVNGASPSAERMREREYVSRTSLEGARERERDHGSQQSGDLGRSFHSRARGSVSLRSNRDSNPSQVDERRREGVQQQPQHHHHQQQQPQDQQLLEPAGASEPMGSGEVADKWCALCEGDGHDSISCPYDKE